MVTCRPRYAHPPLLKPKPTTTCMPPTLQATSSASSPLRLPQAPPRSAHPHPLTSDRAPPPPALEVSSSPLHAPGSTMPPGHSAAMSHLGPFRCRTSSDLEQPDRSRQEWCTHAMTHGATCVSRPVWVRDSCATELRGQGLVQAIRMYAASNGLTCWLTAILQLLEPGGPLLSRVMALPVQEHAATTRVLWVCLLVLTDRSRPIDKQAGIPLRLTRTDCKQATPPTTNTWITAEDRPWNGPRWPVQAWNW